MVGGPRQGLTLGRRQRLALLPALRTGLAILRMPAAELAEAAARLVAENPFVVALPPRPGPRPGAPAAAIDALAAPASASAALRAQIAAAALPPAVRAMAHYLVDWLDDDGYLDADLAEVAAKAGVPLALAEAGLAALQACDPPGVGARDLEECLALQLADRGLARAEAAALVAALDLVAVGDVPGLARRLGTDRAGAEAALALVRGLAPRPLAAAGPPAAPLHPDLVLDPLPSGGFAVRLGRLGLPRIRLDRALAAHAAARGFAADRRAEAAEFIAALRFRGATLLAVGRLLAERQHRCFALGPEHLAPLTRAELAAALGLHASTVGRAVAGKAILAGGTLWPLAALFSAALPGPGGGRVSAHGVRRRLARLIAAEPPGRPLSDAALCQALRAEGVDIARRTVTKYRQALRIPAAPGRRRGAGAAAVRGGAAGNDRHSPRLRRSQRATGLLEQEDP